MGSCPRCQQPLPEAFVRFCPSCGAAIEAGAEAAPPPLPPATAAEGDGIPWEPRRLGLLDAFFETTRMVLGRPTAFFRAMPKRGGLGAPLGYAVLVGWLGLVVSAVYQAILHSVLGSGLGGLAERPEWTRVAAFVEGWAALVVQAVFGPIFVAIGLLIGAGVCHVMLLLLGGARRDFEATFRVMSYAQAASVLLLVPFCGQLVFAVWALVLYVIGLAEAHGIGHGRAAAAVLLPVMILCCCCAGLVLFVIGGVAAGLSQIR
jgi:hypothetical protein